MLSVPVVSAFLPVAPCSYTVPYRVTATWELIKERKYKDPLECKLDLPSRPAFTAG